MFKTIKSWIKALFWAFLIALIFRAFFVQSYIVTSSKMEKTLLDGDFVFVNKMIFGARLPITLVSFPFVGETLPFTSIKSYFDLIQLPYLRLPGYSNINVNDLVVFNYPQITDKPIDNKETYIKRCVALPGDTLRIDNKTLYVNGKEEIPLNTYKYNYRVVTDGSKISADLLKKYGITEGGIVADIGVYDFAMTKETSEKLLLEKSIKHVRPLKVFPREKTEDAFPSSKFYLWNVDYFGPVVIPKKGVTVSLNSKNIELYKRIIDIYEDNNLYVDEIKDIVAINGKEVTSYTFKQDYYFVVDDNRDNAKDSRHWGFLPESHIVGVPSFIWFSIDRSEGFSIRWNRLGKIS